MPFKTLTVPDWTQPQLDTVIAGGAAPTPPVGTLLSGVCLSSDWNALPTYFQATISLTTTGTSGAATFIGNTLNIPQYAGATYTAGTGLTLTAGVFSVNTSQNIATLSNLTSNGLIKTSGGVGTLGIATAGTDYLTPTGNGSGLTAITAANISAGTAGINISGNAATVTTNANLTGDVTSVGNATTIGTGKVTGAMMSGTGAVRVVVANADNAGTVLSTGALKSTITVPFTGTIAKWYLSADQSGSIVMDVKRSGTSIVGAGNKPTLSSAISGNAAPASWTSVAVTKGDILTWNIDSVTTITNINLVLEVTVT